MLEYTFTSSKFTIWHILASINKPEHVQLLETLLIRYQDKITLEIINRTDTGGMTPCHAAAYAANAEALRLLVKHGANPTLPGLQGETPLEIARRRHYANQDILSKIESIIENYVKIYQEAVDKRERSEMFTAVKRPKKSSRYEYKVGDGLELTQALLVNTSKIVHYKPD